MSGFNHVLFYGANRYISAISWCYMGRKGYDTMGFGVLYVQDWFSSVYRARRWVNDIMNNFVLDNEPIL